MRITGVKYYKSDARVDEVLRKASRPKSILRTSGSKAPNNLRVEFEKETVLQGNSIFSDRQIRNPRARLDSVSSRGGGGG